MFNVRYSGLGENWYKTKRFSSSQWVNSLDTWTKKWPIALSPLKPSAPHQLEAPHLDCHWLPKGFDSIFCSPETSPGGSGSKVLACNAGDPEFDPWVRGSPGEGNGNPPQYSCLQNPTEEPGRLQSMGSQRVGHNWASYTHILFPEWNRDTNWP